MVISVFFTNSQFYNKFKGALCCKKLETSANGPRSNNIKYADDTVVFADYIEHNAETKVTPNE